MSGQEIKELKLELAYWQDRCFLAEACIAASPCDIDITEKQIKAHEEYNYFLRERGQLEY